MILRHDGQPMFTLGMYERPRDDREWKTWTDAGINLVCCHSREHLDENRKWGAFGWVPVPMILRDDDGDGAVLIRRVAACFNLAVLWPSRRGYVSLASQVLSPWMVHRLVVPFHAVGTSFLPAYPLFLTAVGRCHAPMVIVSPETGIRDATCRYAGTGLLTDADRHISP